jgi:hypothetical protein
MKTTPVLKIILPIALPTAISESDTADEVNETNVSGNVVITANNVAPIAISPMPVFSRMFMTADTKKPAPFTQTKSPKTNAQTNKTTVTYYLYAPLVL